MESWASAAASGKHAAFLGRGLTAARNSSEVLLVFELSLRNYPYD